MSQFYIQSINKPIDAKLFNKELGDWIMLVHDNMLKRYNSKPFELYKNDFGYDTYGAMVYNILKEVSTQDIFASMQNSLDLQKYIAIAHQSWCFNYLYWKNMENKKISKHNINNKDRNERARRNDSNLEDEDIEMYTDVIEIVFEKLKINLLEVGMQTMNM